MTPLRLVLMRHAKSSWNHPGMMDHDRPLNDRGRRSARAMGDWLRAVNHVPDQILSSTATRTRETAALLGFEIAPDFTRKLYHAGPDEMMGVLNGATARTVLMLGHNPGIAWFADMLLGRPPEHPRFADYPTCATLVAEFPADAWPDVAEGSGTALQFAVPRDLMT
ncbi:histidine phosphatase family protein [Roseovarius sp. SCSIO 43702]|uniref:SixA phosphatase family protein n=1 Tax=Roseovarius sp. SCSIO 43702 TaxID=2823043 RepID=UPI001C731900|nr:histidine phosphatase family protein [Roseovarius sp. SCSIO 43702]QYX56730.1 histidine phosphatase family protein [Roseovarius sp. SCSIO 43702]